MSVATLHSNASPRECPDDRMRTFNEVQQGIKHFFAAFNDSKKQRSAPLSKASHGMEQYFSPSRLPPRPAGPPPPENVSRKQSTSKLTTVVSLTTISPVERSTSQSASAASTSPTEVRPQSENLKLDTDLESRGRAGTAEKKPAPHSHEASLLSSPSSEKSIPKHIHVLGVQGQTEGHSLLNPVASRIEGPSTNLKQIESNLQPQEQSQQQLIDQAKSEPQQQTQITTTSIHIETIRTTMTPRVNEVSWIDSDVAMEVSVKVDKTLSPEPLQVSQVAPENSEMSTSSITRSLSAVSDGELIENENENEILKTTSSGVMEKSFVVQAPTTESDSEFHMDFVDNYLDQIASTSSTSTVSSVTSSSSVPIVETQETSHADNVLSVTSSSSSSTSTPANSSSQRQTSLFGFLSSNKENTSTPSTVVSSEKPTVEATTSVPQETPDMSKEGDDDDEFVMVEAV